MSTRDEFINGYIDALLWCETVPNDPNGSDREGTPADEFEPSGELKQKATKEAGDFFDANRTNIYLAAEKGLPYVYSGHDFALTRNGHGAGFWDRRLGELGDRLTDAADKWGETHLYLDDDGLVHQD